MPIDKIRLSTYNVIIRNRKQQKGKVKDMTKIIDWLMSCGYSKEDAMIEANKMIEANRWDGCEKCSREFAIEMILENIL